MTGRSVPLPGYISYEQWLRQRIAGAGGLCHAPVCDPPTLMQQLFPFLKPAAIRELEHQARELEIGT